MDREGLRQWLIMNYNSTFFLANSYHAQRPALKGSFSFHIKPDLNGTYGSVSTLAKKRGVVWSWIDSEELCQKIKTLQALWMSLLIHGTLLLFNIMSARSPEWMLTLLKTTNVLTFKETAHKTMKIQSLSILNRMSDFSSTTKHFRRFTTERVAAFNRKDWWGFVWKCNKMNRKLCENTFAS